MEEKKSVGNIVMIVILIIAIIGLGVTSFLAFKLNSEKTKLVQDNTQLNTMNGNLTKTIQEMQGQIKNLNYTIKTYELGEKLPQLYMDRLTSENNSSPEKLNEFRVDKVEVYDSAKREETVKTANLTLGENEYLAVVTYSVKPLDINSAYWINGSGQVEGEWIVNKTSNVVIEEIEGNYKIKKAGQTW